MLLYIRDEFGHNRISKRTTILRIDRIGVIKIGTRVLKGHGNHPRKIIRRPGFVVRISLPKSSRRAKREMSLYVMNRIINIRMSIITFGKKDNCS